MRISMLSSNTKPTFQHGFFTGHESWTKVGPKPPVISVGVQIITPQKIRSERIPQ